MADNIVTLMRTHCVMLAEKWGVSSDYITRPCSFCGEACRD